MKTLEQHDNNPDPHLMENVMNPVETEVTVHQETIKSTRDWWTSKPSNENVKYDAGPFVDIV